MKKIEHIHVQSPPSDRDGRTRDAVEAALCRHGYEVGEITRDTGPLDLSLPDDLPPEVRAAVWAAAERA